jgi:hypothetical protein
MAAPLILKGEAVVARGRLFINYRRDDSRADSGRLYDRLAVCFPGRVFRDVASLQPGVEWDDAIARVLGQSDACIVVIGKDWLTITDALGRRRLDDPRDSVRREVVVALQRQMRVFPVLVGGARMPPEEELPAELQSLCRRHAIELTEQDWDEDIRKLVKALETVLGPSSEPGARRSAIRRGWVIAAGAALAAAIGVAMYSEFNKSPGSSPQIRDREAGAPPVTQQVTQPPPVETRIPAPAPTAPFNPAALVGLWRAVVSGESQVLDEPVEVFQDHSFRARFQGKTAAVGRWRYDSRTEALQITDAANFLNNGIKFACTWRMAGEQAQSFAGTCVDRMQNSWSVSLTRTGEELEEPEFDTPRVDVSGLTAAERAAFSEVLAGQPCTCTCGMTLHLCLREDRSCQFSPNLARLALAAFLRVTRA